MAFQPLFRPGAIPGAGGAVQGGVFSPLAFWMGGAGMIPGTPVIVVPPTPEVTPPPIGPEGAGAPVKQPRGSPHAPAFGRGKPKELKEFLFPVPPAEVAEPAQRAAPTQAERGTPELGPVPSPLPLLADFGAGPVTIGIRLPSRDEIARLIEADDEEVIIATLIALGMLD